MKYTSSYRRAQTINGLRGYDYEIRESLSGRVVHYGWTAGGVRDAKQEIERAIRKIESKEAA